jgi:hypothetical protein
MQANQYVNCAKAMPFHTAADSAHRGVGIAYKLYRGPKICEFQADKAGGLRTIAATSTGGRQQASPYAKAVRLGGAPRRCAKAAKHGKIATAGF